MNKRLHRVVFNAARGMRVAVQETARVAGKASGATPVVMAAVLMSAWPVSAQIAGSPGAPPNLRPTVLLAPNGVPLVNIQTPSAAGVSRNLYRQFDVQPRGVILNNSRTNVQTQLGGWVQGNPYLATGPARIILNEITNGNPTQLRGAIEVGGQRAEVIVANPAGIAVDGATFINASRATLTTGTPQLNAFGGLDGYVVRGGTVSVDGAGLDARGTDYAAILARAVQVNAGIWANELEVVTGANQVSGDQAQATLTPGTATPPAFALDVSHLGGMYAGKITLIGTEAGLGVRNAGSIGAAAGELVVTAAGRLENRGTLEARSLQIAAAGDIDNRGGTMRQTSGVGLTLSAQALSNTAGGLIHFGAGSETVANNDLGLATTGNITNGGRLAAGHALTLSGRNIENTASGDIQGHSTILNAGETLTNRGVIDGVVTRVHAGTLNNIGTGRIYGDQVSIEAGVLNNDAESVNGVTTAATIAARNRLDIGAGTINNGNGALIFSGEDLFIGGALTADGKATGTAGALNNHAATIEALRKVDIKTDALNNTNGGVTWTTQAGPAVHRIEYALPGSSTRYDPSQLVFATTVGPTMEFEKMMGALWPVFGSTTGAIGNAAYGILVPSAAYPLSRFKPYYDAPPRNSVELHGERAVGIDQTEHYTETGAWYSRNDPIWATFGVAPPATDTPSGDAQQQAYLEAHQRLDTATSAFIADVYRNLSRAYSYWVYDESARTPVLQTSAPARIISGGAMNIAVGSGTNDTSQIVAGGTLTVTGGTIQNKNLEVNGSVDQVGVQGFHPGPSGSEQLASYNLSVPVTVTLAAARQEGNTAPMGTGTALGTPTPGHTNQAVAGTGSTHAAVPAGTGGGTGTAVSPIVQVRLAASSTAAGVVRTTLPGLNVPGASLFRNHPEPGSRYLVETDPRFANYRSWLSSDYVLQRLGLDPDTTQKRLGDGYYEQRLVREQIAQLTGQRNLDGYTSDEAQYQALMDAGLTFAQQYHLTPGIALSDAQMAQLTSDIVWLVEQTVTLPDGGTQRVLVPQVYVRAKEGDIDGSGALLAGREVDIKLGGDLVNSGTIAGRQVASLTAENIKNLNGRISGDSVSASARSDLDIIGGVIDAGSRLDIDAGRDINVRSTTKVAGQPDAETVRNTGKAWIPTYRGPDRWRHYLAYKGQGVLVFAGAAGGGEIAEISRTKAYVPDVLIQIIHNPKDSGSL